MTNSNYQSISEANDDTEQADANRRMAEEIGDINAFVVRIHSLHSIEPKESASLLAEHGLIDLELASYEKAIQWCDKSLEIDEENFKALYCKAMTLIELDRLMDALPYLELAVKSSHNNVKVRQMFEKVSEHVSKSSIDRLTDDALIQIFLLLPFIERMRIELVSDRFNRLANKQGWSNFYKLSYQVSKSHNGKRRNMGKLVAPLFERCKRFLQEINMRDFYEMKTVFYKQISELPNLQHLIMRCRMTASDIGLIDSAVFSKLKSLNLAYQDGWNGMLKNCSNLELLIVHLNASMASIYIPPTLKYLNADLGLNFSSQLFWNVIEQAKQLESLVLRTHGGEIGFANKFKLDGLKYLSVCFSYRPSIHNAHTLESLLKNASCIKALDVTAFESFSVESVARCVDQLEHLQITCNFFFYADYFVGCADNFRFLSSLSILGAKHVNIQVIKFFQQLASHGNLVYFEISGVMPMKSICKALRVCTNLKYLSWKFDKNTDWNLLLQTLDEIHGGKKPSDESDYEHILRVFGFYQVPLIEHPWLKFCCGRIVSPIRERCRVGCLSSKPKFYDY